MRGYSRIEYLSVMIKCLINAPAFYSRPYQDYSQTQSYQLKKLKKLLRHVYLNFPLYRKKYDSVGVNPQDLKSVSDLAKFPPVTKSEIISSFPKTPQPKLIESVSSGTSGQIIRVLHDPGQTWPYILGQFRVRDITGAYRPTSRVLHIYTSPFPANSFFGLFKNYFISTLASVHQIAKTIRLVHPDIICSYPSRLLDIVSYLKSKGVSPPLVKFINVGSEMSSRLQRQIISGFFSCPVLDEYSLEELGWVASECQYGTYHLWEDISVLETSDDGEILGTNLHNAVMPFIRYRTGDLGQISRHTFCPCGRRTRQLARLVGRKNDRFVFANGQTLSPSYLLDATYDLLLKDQIDMSDFCLVQLTPNQVKLELIPGPKFDSSQAERAAVKLKKLFPVGVKIKISPTRFLTTTLTGKRNPIINQVNQKPRYSIRN